MDVSFTGIEGIVAKTKPRAGKLYGVPYSEIIEELSFKINDIGSPDLAVLKESGFFDSFVSKKGEGHITLKYSRDTDTNPFDTKADYEFETINGKKITKKLKDKASQLIEILKQHQKETGNAVEPPAVYEKMAMMIRMMNKKVRLIE